MSSIEHDLRIAEAAARRAHARAQAEGRICACEGPHTTTCLADGSPARARLEETGSMFAVFEYDDGTARIGESAHPAA